MKPISLRLKNFGPFIEEQFIDFTALEKSGLFLIYGNTGSGKTTILDAVCCALYCASSSGTRFGAGETALEKMRCQMADPAEETFVEFIFESASRRYKFYREISLNKRGTNYKKSHFCGVYNGVEYEPPESNLTMGTVTRYAEEIIGLKAEQFRQVVILPQGKFEELLTSPSRDKEEILSGIFNTEKWERIIRIIHEKVAEEKNRLDAESERMQAELAAHGCESTDDLSEKIRTNRKKISEYSKREKSADKEIESLSKALDVIKMLDEAFKDYDSKKANFEKLSEKKEKSVHEASALKLADQALGIKPVYDKLHEALRAKEAAKAALDQEKARLKKAEADVKAAQEEAALHDQQKAHIETKKAEKISLESKTEIYSGIEEKKAAFEAAAEKLRSAEKAEKQAEVLYQKEAAALLEARDSLAEAEDIFKRARDNYDKNICGEIAKTLSEGEKCPVCGSTCHPEPARETESSITKEALDRLEKKKNDAESLHNGIREKTEALRAQAETLRKKTADVKNEKTAAEAAYSYAEKSMIPGIGSLRELHQKTEALKEEIRRFEKKTEELRAKLDTASAEKNRYSGTVESAAEANAKSESDLESAGAGWRNALENTDFSSDEAFRLALIDQEALKNRKEKLAALESDYKIGKKLLEEAEAKTAGKQRPDTQEKEAELKKRKAERQTIHDELTLAENETKILVQVLADLTAREQNYRAEREKNDKNAAFSECISGRRGGVSLKRYVLGTMLDLVTRNANEMLSNIYGGRYRIRRSEGSQGRNRIAGLDFEIEDYQCGKFRSASDISGGEKFLVSLSLALGLSDVVRNQAECVNLETIFIDEGFGTLDKNCLDDAMLILKTVRDRKGMVGVISHVDALAENIPAKIETVKYEKGSRCRIYAE